MSSGHVVAREFGRPITRGSSRTVTDESVLTVARESVHTIARESRGDTQGARCDVAVYTAAADALAARVLRVAPPGVVRVFDRAATGTDGIETTPFHVGALAAAFAAADGPSASDANRAVGENLADRAAGSPVSGRAAVRAVLNGPVAVPPVGSGTLCRVASRVGSLGVADATLLAAHDTRHTTAVLTDRPSLRRHASRVVWEE